MPPPLVALSAIARLSGPAVSIRLPLEGQTTTVQFWLYDLLRREQALATARAQPSEFARILDLAQAAYGDLVGLLVGRDDALLDAARDAEWSLRDLLRHVIAVELRYAAQIHYSATRGDDDTLAIPSDRLPCDRLAPPEPDFTATRRAGFIGILELLGMARARSDELLEMLPDVVLERPSLWGSSQIDVRMRTHQIAAHLSESTIQCEQLLVAAGQPDAEARRIARRCCAMRGAHERRTADTDRAELDARYDAIASGIAAGAISHGASAD